MPALGPDKDIAITMAVAAGAKCNQCFMSGHCQPALTETHDGDVIGILCERPSLSDVEQGRPLTDQKGTLVTTTLAKLGVPRYKCRIGTVIACRPPADDMNMLMRRSRADDKKRQKAGTSEAKGRPPISAYHTGSPIGCCEPRLANDFKDIKYLIVMGTTAYQAVKGGAGSIDSIRGSCETIINPWHDMSDKGKRALKVVYTYDPGRVLNEPILGDVFQHDIAKGLRFFKNRLDWVEPEIVICRTIDDVKAGFRRLIEAGEPVAYDCEAYMGNPMWTMMKCITFSNSSLSVLVPWWSQETHCSIWTDEECAYLYPILRMMLTTKRVKLIAHNGGTYDRLLIEHNLGVTPRLAIDTILLHLLADNELRHGLGFIGSYYTDMPEAWKADHTATQSVKDMELWTYCAKDGCVTQRVAPKLYSIVRERSQEHLIGREHMLQDVAANMQKLGMRIDSNAVAIMRQDYEEKAKIAIDTCVDVCKQVGGPANFNPRSFPQVANILFNKFGLNAVSYSEDTGEPSTGDDDLRVMLIQYKLEEGQRRFIEAIRQNRTYDKKLSMLRSLIPHTRFYYTPSGERRAGILGDDGRVHPSYHRLPATGRYSSSDPNWQNQESELRVLAIPEDGNIFVGCDEDQLEFRYICEEAKALRALAVINGGKVDPHNATMEAIYGPGIWQLPGAPKIPTKKGEPDSIFYNTRGVTKNVRYAWQYWAGVKRVWEQVTSVQDKDGKLIYANVRMEPDGSPNISVREIMEGLTRADPEIPNWWHRTLDSFKRNGYIGDSLWDRRRYFRNRPTVNEMVNHPIQAGGFALVAEAMLECLYGKQRWFTTTRIDLSRFDTRLLAYDFRKKRGLTTNTHDSLAFECRWQDGDEVQAMVTAMMTRRRLIGALLTYTAEAKQGYNWRDI